MTRTNQARRRRMAVLKPSNSARFNIQTADVPADKYASAPHVKESWRHLEPQFPIRHARQTQSPGQSTAKSITCMDSFCKDFTFKSTLKQMPLPRAPTPVTPFFVNLKPTSLPASEIIPIHPYRPPLHLSAVNVPLRAGPPPPCLLRPDVGVAPSLFQQLQALNPRVSPRKIKNLPVRKGATAILADEIRFIQGIPVLPDFPLPTLPVIPDPHKAKEALRHRSSYKSADEQSYDMLALVGDAKAEVYCREYAYEMVPRINTHLTTQIKSCIVRNTTWAQLSLRYGLSSNLLCSPHTRHQLETRLKIQADLFEAHLGAFWLSFPEKERDSKASPILRAYFRQLLDHLFPLFHRFYTSSQSTSPILLPPRSPLVTRQPPLPLNVQRINERSTAIVARSGSVLEPIVIRDDEDADVDRSDSDDAWFEVIGTNVLLQRGLSGPDARSRHARRP